MKKISIVVSCGIIVLSILIFCIARTYPGVSNGAPGPGFFPMILSAIMFFLAVLLLVTIRKEKSEPLQLFTKTNATVFLTLLITVAYVTAMRIVGFPLATLFYLFGLMLFFRVKSWPILICVPVFTTGLIYGVFTHFLAVQFPQGMLFN